MRGAGGRADALPAHTVCQMAINYSSPRETTMEQTTLSSTTASRGCDVPTWWARYKGELVVCALSSSHCIQHPLLTLWLLCFRSYMPYVG